MNNPSILSGSKNRFFSYVGKGNAMLFAFACLFFVVFGSLWVASFFFPNNDLLQYSVGLTLLYGAGALVVLACAFFCARSLPQNSFVKKHTALCVAIFLACCLPLQGILFFNVYYQPGWDVSILTESGYWLATNMGVPTNHYSYFASYPNNITLLMIWAYFFKLLIKVFHFYDYLFAAIMLSAVLANLALFEVYRVAARHFGKKSALLALCCGVPLISFAPWMTNPYSDTMTILFPILIFDLLDMAFVAKSNKKKIVLSLAAGICTGLGMMIKPTVVIILIAICLGWLFCTQGKKMLINIVAIILCAALSCGAVAGTISTFGTKALENTGITKEYVEQVRFPFTHFLMMGMQKQVSPFNDSKYQYGKWYADDVVKTFDQVGQAAKVKTNLEEVQKRLTQLGAAGYASFLFDKARWVLGDGAMYFGGETLPITECFQQTAFARALQSFYWRDGENYAKVLAHLLQGVWMLVLAMCCASAWWSKGRRMLTQTIVLQAAVVGIVLFILLFEGRSRYLINYLPIFLLLAAQGFARFSQAGLWQQALKLFKKPAKQ